MNARKWILAVGAALALIAAALWTTGAYAQGYGPGTMMAGTMRGNGHGMSYGPGMMGGQANSLIAVAADKLGMTQPELVAALGSDQTIAALAQAQGVDPATIVDAFVATHTAQMDAMVAAGRLTREAADQRVATMRANVTARLSQPGLGAGYADANGDGVCDNAGGYAGGMGNGRRGR